METKGNVKERKQSSQPELFSVDTTQVRNAIHAQLRHVHAYHRASATNLWLLQFFVHFLRSALLRTWGANSTCDLSRLALPYFM